MIYFLALLPATVLTIAGYFVLYLSGRSEGALRTFGKYLGFWAFTLAGLLILGAVFAAAHGGHHCPVFGMHGMHERMHGPWPPMEERPGVGPPAPNSTAAPAPPPPAPR
jgi:heme A synthase